MKKEFTAEYFRDWWLKKYHNTTSVELVDKEPELIKTSAWYDKYAVTDEQHDEWYEWAVGEVAKKYRCSKKAAKRLFCFPYLDLAPSIKKLKQ